MSYEPRPSWTPCIYLKQNSFCAQLFLSRTSESEMIIISKYRVFKSRTGPIDFDRINWKRSNYAYYSGSMSIFFLGQKKFKDSFWVNVHFFWGQKKFKDSSKGPQRGPNFKISIKKICQILSTNQSSLKLGVQKSLSVILYLFWILGTYKKKNSVKRAEISCNWYLWVTQYRYFKQKYPK